MKKDCIFCKIVKGLLPAKFVYKDRDIVAFWDIKPVAPVHIIVIPVKHIDSLSSSCDEDIVLLGKTLRVTAKVAEKMKLKAFRVLAANGSKAGQTVQHLHFHLVGGWKKKSPQMESEPKG